MTRCNEHVHAADDFQARRGMVLKKIYQKIEKIKRNPSVPVRRAYDKAADADSDTGEDVPDFTNVRTRAMRYRARFMPPFRVHAPNLGTFPKWAPPV